MSSVQGTNRKAQGTIENGALSTVNCKVKFMERLLEGVAVEWRALGEVTLPTANIRWRETDKEYRYIDLTSVCRERSTILETTKISADNAPSRAQKLVLSDDVLFATTRPTQMRFCLITEDYSGEIASTGYCILRAIKSVLLPKWILYWIASSDFKMFVEENQSGSAYPAISDSKLKEFQIPIPCPDNPKKSLEIQTEIVRILDTFTELTTRKKQYNYYRDKFLTFEEGEVEWKPFGKIGEICRGTAITEKETNPGGYPVVANGPSHNYYHDQSNRTGETIVIARSGAYAGLVSYWDIPIFLTDAFSIHPDNNVLSPKFLYYVLKKDQTKIHNMSKGAGVPHIRAKDFESYEIPIPYPNDPKKSLAEQARIVSILDKFSTLTTSLTSGLPREIELRQKQYEYYRNMLLSFPEAAKS
jgi:type I restriction enzyme, S subunit